MAPTDVLLKTARDYVSALSEMDTDTLKALTTDDYTATIAPASARYGDDNGKASREVFIERFKALRQLVQTFGMKIIREWPPNEQSNQVTLHVRGDTMFHPHLLSEEERKTWDLTGEVLFILTMDESGTKINDKFDFTDSIQSTQMAKVFASVTSKLGVAEIPGGERVLKKDGE